MKNKELLEKIKPFAVVTEALAITICAVIALEGYTPVSYPPLEKNIKTVAAAENKSNDIVSQNEVNIVQEETVSETAVEIADVVENEMQDAVFNDGEYFGTGSGFSGQIKVRVCIENGKITQITIMSSTDDTAFLEKAKNMIPVMIEKQSYAVDGVSGATYSSRGIKEAVKNALMQALKEDSAENIFTEEVIEEEIPASTPFTAPTVDAAELKQENNKLAEQLSDAVYKDGVYEGVSTGFAGDIKVEVMVENGRISRIEVTETNDGEPFMKSASSILDVMIDKQSVDVDTVSGATYSSNGIIGAVVNALSQAVVDKNDNPILNFTAQQTVNTENPSDNISDTTSPKPLETPQPSYLPAEMPTPANTITPSAAVTESPSDNQPSEGLKNGEYKVSSLCEPDMFKDFDAYDLSATVVISDGKISEIKDIKGSGNKYIAADEWYISRAANGIGNKGGVVLQLIGRDNTENVDVVSGATCSSKAIIEAVEKALIAAKQVKDTIN